MKIYVDGLLFLNFFFDFLLLLTVVVSLKRNVPMFKVILGAFIGSLSILVLFFKINSLELFLVKIILSILMIIVTFGFKNFKTFMINILVFYVVSILLGGFLYMLNIDFSYKHKGLIFFNKGLSINVIFLFIFAPIILYIYVWQEKMYRNKISNFHKTDVFIGQNVLHLNGYLDTGNTLLFKKRPVVITNVLNTFRNKKYYVPYTVIGGYGIIECIKVKIHVEDLGDFNDIYLGFSDKLNIAGADVLLNGLMREEIK
jgi:stage II sporulation protein GA (sporulation sigma-E factor processing peptidase)